MRPVRLRVEIGHKEFMDELGAFPTGHLLKRHLTHSSHDVEMGFYQVHPALAWGNEFFLGPQRLTNPQELFGAKDRSIVGDEPLWWPKSRDGGVEDNQHAAQILPLKDGAGENGPR